MENVRFGIIGLGGIADQFAKVLGATDGVDITAVAARCLERARVFAGKHGAKSAYGSYLELVQDPAVQVVYIATTHNLHCDIAKLCIEHSKGVLCEKPFFLTRSEAEEVVALAKAKNVLLMEAMWTRCLPAYQRAKEWVKGGRIGKTKYIDAKFAFHVPYDADHRLYDPKVAGGALYDAGVYPIAFVLGMAGAAPVEVHSVNTFAPTDVDDYTAVQMRFADGVLGTAVCGINGRASEDAAIYGTDGHVVVYNFLRTQKCTLFDTEDNVLETFHEPVEHGFVYEIQHVAALIRAGQIESSLVPWADTIACAGVFDAVTKDWPNTQR